MNPTAVSNSQANANPATFPLLWTLGLSGHRRLPDETAARAALREEIAKLVSEAALRRARLTAVSSIALGADLVFAEECLAAGLPWKCMLPFPKEEFRKDDFTDADWARAEACLAKAYRVEVTSAGNPPDAAARNVAYLDCGHRMVEAADVLLLLWNGKPAAGKGGTGDLWDYTRTLSKPIWHFNTETGEVRRAGWPGEGEWKKRAIFKSRVTPLILDAESHPVAAKNDAPPPDHPPPSSPTLEALCGLYARLDEVALTKQGDAHTLMKRVLVAHLLATSAAALSVTVVANGSWHALHGMAFLAVIAALTFSLLVLAKPVLAALAMRWERKLHHLKSREFWMESRVAAELCRSAIVSWRFPTAPLRLFEQEDFPHFKRLVRTLRLAREADTSPSAALDESAAIAHYQTNRIDAQFEYFEKKHKAAQTEHDGWQRKFSIATWFVIVVGGIVGIVEACGASFSIGHIAAAGHAGVTAQALHMIESTIACLLIIAPFYASYALAMLAVRDCRRRVDRFRTMMTFLGRQKLRLDRVKSTASRIAVIENTERMLLEELHEWYSVMKAVRV